LIHLSHGLVDLLNTAALLDGGGRSFLHQCAELLDIVDHAIDNITRRAHLATAFHHFAIRRFDQGFYLLSGSGRTAGELANLIGDGSEAAPLFSSVRLPPTR